VKKVGAVMKKKTLIRWTIVSLLLLTAFSIYCVCSTWPGREISDSAMVLYGGKAVDNEVSQRVLKMIRRPHIPNESYAVAEHASPGTYGGFSILDGETTYDIHFHRRSNVGRIQVLTYTGKGNSKPVYGKRYYFHISAQEQRIWYELFL